MSFTQIQITNLRNLLEAKVSPTPGFNLLFGENGSGKTSFLEAIYYLGLGRSFRTRHNNRVITHETDQLAIFAQIQQDGIQIPIGFERHSNGKSRIRVNKENKSSVFEITKLIPIQILNPESRDLLTGSSKGRRRFIDWGVFHVEPSFLSAWQQAQRALKQRNAALKSNAPKNMIDLWNIELDSAAQTLSTYRKEYLTALEPTLAKLLSLFFEDQFDISLTYKAGWDEEAGLNQTLARTLDRDLQLGYTQHGPHRTDLLIRVNKNLPAHDVLSQGQQKLLVYALHLAQGLLLKEHTAKKCIYLLDDLPAELDVANRQRVAQALTQMDAQVFITGVDREALSALEKQNDTGVFHVEHGAIKQV